jgi:hypothetical protein
MIQMMNKRASRRDNMKKYRVSLEVDKEWVKNFDLTFDAVDEQDAEAQAMVEVKMNLGDYITAYADEEDELLSKKIDAQYYEENKK